MVGLVVGLAVQSMIADVFSGIAINIDRPFKIGDWIRLNLRGIPDMLGCVEGELALTQSVPPMSQTSPNSLLGQIIVTNLVNQNCAAGLNSCSLWTLKYPNAPYGF